MLADLRWLLLSPPLLTDATARTLSAPHEPAGIQDFSPAERAVVESWLTRLGRAPTDAEAGGLLELAQANRQLRLGRYAERLLAFYLREGPLHKLLAANLPLRHSNVTEDRTTRGEIDFLLTDPQGRGWHWELAVKFFVCDSLAAQVGVDDFVGPDRAEPLRSKLAKLFTRQLQLRPDAPWNTRSWHCAAFAKAWIFYRHGKAVPACDSFNPRHCRGWWLPRDAIDELPPGPYLIAPRARWLSPMLVEHSLPPESAPALLPTVADVANAFDQLRSAQPKRDTIAPPIAHPSAAPIAHTIAPPFAQMLIQLEPCEQGWRERSRGFVQAAMAAG